MDMGQKRALWLDWGLPLSKFSGPGQSKEPEVTQCTAGKSILKHKQSHRSRSFHKAPDAVTWKQKKERTAQRTLFLPLSWALEQEDSLAVEAHRPGLHPLWSWTIIQPSYVSVSQSIKWASNSYSGWLAELIEVKYIKCYCTQGHCKCID